jgi:hypothetical protein
MIKKIVHFFDKLEDSIRHALSVRPLLYALVGGVGVVFFWRGVWHLGDYISFSLLGLEHEALLDALVSITAGAVIMLLSGLFVSFFVGDAIIMSGLRGEKKLIEKTKGEVKTEIEMLEEIKTELRHIESKMTN